MDTSKTRSIKSLLLQAWRERWTDIAWGIRIKSVLPRGVSGDVYDLADCILQQALVGPGPNNLFMSYLMHSLSSRVVSYGAVLSSIGRYQSFYKPYCILSLLDLLKTFQSRIGCHGNEEECIALCKAIVSVTHWLYSCVYHSITKLTELKQSPEHISIMEKSYETLYYFSNSTFIKSLLYVGKFEDQAMYTQMLHRHKELEEKLTLIPSAINVSKEIMEEALSLVCSVDTLPMVPSQNKSNNKFKILASSLNIMVGIDAILNPASDIEVFVSQLLLVKRLQNFKLSQVYCEIIRACMIGIANTSGSFEDDLKWFAFTFLKLPNLISQIQTSTTVKEENAFEKGLYTLLRYSPLLDLTDLRSNSDSLNFMIQELIRAEVITETQGSSFLDRRLADTFKPVVSPPAPNNGKSQNSGNLKPPPTPKQNPQGGQANIPLILRAEHTLNTILKSLDSDYTKIQEALLGVLCHILPLRNFKLILAAAAATGKLHLFVSKLIGYNEFNKNVASETPKSAITRMLTFDVTFLLLFYIAQYYGIEVMFGPSTNDSFFVQWISENLAEGGKFKCPDSLLSKCDQTIVDMLLAQFLNTDQELKTYQVKWHEVCLNAPAAVREIVIAWEHNALSTEKVKIVLDHIKSTICCLPACVSAWLCNYINVLHHEERLKPMNMLQHFIAPPAVESVTSPSESPSASGRQTPQMAGSEQLSSLTYNSGRMSLMNGIVKLMMWDLHPPHQKLKMTPLIAHGLTVKEPLGKILDEVFNDVHYRGWLDVKSIHYFDTLLCVGGARWLCDALVRRILGYHFLQDINRAVDMIIGIFYLDIEQCALALLLHVLPFYLYSEVHQEELAEPYGSALSRLTVITTYSALQFRQCSTNSRIKTGCKRSHCEVDIDDTRDHTEHSRPTKIHRSNAELLEDTPFELQSVSDEHMRNAVANPINKAIADLMRTLLVIASDATISARSYFPIRFLEQVVLCAKDQASAILQFMPLGLVGLLLKKYPEEFSHELILAVSSMQSPRARKVAALSLCQLTIAENRLTTKNKSWMGF